MKKDISEYVASSLDGFGYKWFNNLDKGTGLFLWDDFEATNVEEVYPTGSR